MEFDRRCGTAQNEDCLQLYIPAASVADTRSTSAAHSTNSNEGLGAADGSAWWPVLSKFHGVDGWPTSAVVLPGDRHLHSTFK